MWLILIFRDNGCKQAISRFERQSGFEHNGDERNGDVTTIIGTAGYNLNPR